MKIIKALVVTILIVTLLFSAFGCSAAQTVATVNGENISAEEYIEQINQMLTYYGTDFDSLTDYYIDYYGDEESGKEAADAYKDSFLDELVIQTIMLQKAAELGLDELSEEETESATQEAQEMLDYYKDYYASMAEEAAADDETINVEEYSDELYQDFLNDVGLDEEKTIELYKESAVLQKVYDYYVADFEPSDDAYKEKYDSLLEEQQSLDETDPDTAYYNYVYGMNEVNVYVPSQAEGNIKICKHIYIPIDDDTLIEITNLQYNNPDELSDEELEAAIDEIKTPALEEVRSQAEECYERLQNGEDFDSLMAEYSADYIEGADNTTEVCEESYNYSEEYVNAAMKLKNIGDTSDIVEANDGFYIIKYEADPEVGPIPYEEVKDEIIANEAETLESDYWYSIIDEWVNDSDVTRISFIDGEGDNISGSDLSSPNSTIIIIIVWVAAAVVILVVVLVVTRKKNRNNETDEAEETRPSDNTDTENNSEEKELTSTDSQPEAENVPEEKTEEDKPETEIVPEEESEKDKPEK